MQERGHDRLMNTFHVRVANILVNDQFGALLWLAIREAGVNGVRVFLLPITRSVVSQVVTGLDATIANDGSH